MSLLPEINQASAEINKFVAQANIHQTIAPVNPAEFTSPADTLLLASRDPVIREVSVGMTGIEAIQNTVSGTPPLSLPNSLGKPLKAWEVDVLPYQEGTGDPSPDNVRPIHGTDKLTITTAGKNLLPMATGESYSSHNMSVTRNNDGTLTLEGTSDDSVSITFVASFPLNAGTYTFSGGSDFTASSTIYFYIRNLDTNATLATITNAVSTSSFTLTGKTNIRFYAVISNSNLSWSGTFKPQLEFGSIASDYVPYVAPSQTVIDVPAEAGTVYGGTLTVNNDGSGSLVVDRVCVTYNGQEEWTEVSGYAGFFRPPILPNSAESRTEVADKRCSIYPYYNGALASQPDKTVTLASLLIAQVHDSAYEGNVNGFRTYLTGTPLQITYELATPITYSITAPTIPTPTGTATTWATAEDGTVDSMSVTYVGKA